MSVPSGANGSPSDAKTASTQPGKRSQKAKARRRNLAIHAKPLPLETHPLPAFHPSNPISLLRLCYAWISDALFSPTSHPARDFVGYFSPETRSVHVTDPRCARILWQMGFFGKGTLSRSEPSWLKREEARVREQRMKPKGRLAAEDWTNVRREERRMFKLERARLEKEKIERQRLIEAGDLPPDEEEESTELTAEPPPEDIPKLTTEITVDAPVVGGHVTPPMDLQNGHINGDSKRLRPTLNGTLLPAHDLASQPSSPLIVRSPQPFPGPKTVEEEEAAEEDEEEESRGRAIENQEHLQLTFEEAFFLVYALGVLTIHPAKRRDLSPLSVKFKPQPYSTIDLLELFCQYSSFPPQDTVWISPDEQFLLNYVAYHHFRSLGWVVRPGQKFGVDYLIYQGGPVIAHAEFAVLIVPAYTDRYWNTPGGRARRRVYEEKDWWQLHCTNRVQSRVLKTLVLCYIDIPSELDMDFDDVIDVGKLMRSYKVREFVVRRWLPNRSRD
ncbi:hypothetical protein BDY17DRAFT_297269 [Neohortaea acidophila]|uniref:tRNA-intron lyase n=1 Tax=Neohortaea acidophila TaxID=245834 RepID=A0A6A6PT91_9PEZI|nr:uncharacterized protein BDY17DRAFT_297269 [Neohortaea acidophila]KAF2483328.1 hypothetical protein BDY17DRAFT_297269 [Neohortaea acidophila]